MFHWQFLNNYIFSISLKLYHGWVVGIQSKECYFMVTYTFLAFFCCWSSKKLCFYHFYFFFFWRSIRLLLHNINQLETGGAVSGAVYINFLLVFAADKLYRKFQGFWMGINWFLQFFIAQHRSTYYYASLFKDMHIP